MAERYYTAASGNWSTTANWDGGVSLPGAGDDVYANGKTVTIDQDITVLSLRTTAGTTAVAGGGFTTGTAGQVITLTGSGVVAGSSTCLTVTNATGTVTLNAAVAGSQTTNAVNGVSKSGAGTLALAGAVVGGNGTSRFGVAATAGTLNLTGNVTGGSASGGVGVNLSSSPTATIVGDVSGAGATGVSAGGNCTLAVTGNVTGGTVTTQHGVLAATNITITITGNVTGGTGNTAQGINHIGAGTTTVSGDVTGGGAGGGAGVAVSNGVVVVTGALIPGDMNAATVTGGRLHLAGGVRSVAAGVSPVGSAGGKLTVESTGTLTHAYRGAVGSGSPGAERTLSTGGGAGPVAVPRIVTNIGTY